MDASQLYDNFYFYNNKCVMASEAGPGYDYAFYEDDTSNEKIWPVMYNNSIFTLDGTASVNGVDLDEYQKSGVHDQGTTVQQIPDDGVIIGWAKDLFGLWIEKHK